MAGVLAAVLFDLDDTLVDQESASRAAVVGWAREHGLTDEAPALEDRWRQISALHYGRYQDRELTYAEQRRARARDFLDGHDLTADAAADAAFAAYLSRYEAAWTAFPDARPALRRASASGLRVGVLTNGDADHQALKLAMTGLSGVVDVLAASSTLSAAKPDPRAFHEACARLGAAPESTLMVGDSLAGDVRGAERAGLPAVLLDRTGAHEGERVSRVDTLADLSFVAD
jgi:putative hydrolase of the HAD superfamily